MADVYHSNYREIILSYLNDNRLVKGYRSKMAKAAGFHPSVLSQVLSRSLQLTPEQSLGLCQFWGMDPRKTEYFITLVNYERASSKALKKFLKTKLDGIRLLTSYERVKVKEVELTAAQAATLYSNWEATAIFSAVDVPGVNDVASLAKFLSIHPLTVEKILLNFEKLGLMSKDKKNKWKRTEMSCMVYQGRDAYIQLLMSNLDAKALTLANGHGNSMWAGATFSTNADQFEKVKTELVKLFESLEKNEEKKDRSMVAGISLHLFELGKL